MAYLLLSRSDSSLFTQSLLMRLLNWLGNMHLLYVSTRLVKLLGNGITCRPLFPLPTISDWLMRLLIMLLSDIWFTLLCSKLYLVLSCSTTSLDLSVCFNVVNTIPLGYGCGRGSGCPIPGSLTSGLLPCWLARCTYVKKSDIAPWHVPCALGP